MESFVVSTEADWPSAWAWLEPKLAGRSILAISGDLGAGKTTFVKTIVGAFGGPAEVTSPTFSLVQEYPTAEGKIYHLDLYRLNSLDEVQDLGLDDYLQQAHFMLIEWPEVATPLLDEKEVCFIRIEHHPEGGRVLLALS